MSRVVYIGGFGNGRNSAERVGNALSKASEEVDVFTFSDFMNHPREVQRAMRGVRLVTHSAGALAIAQADSRPSFAYLLNPPLPQSIGKLLLRTVIKTARMNTPGQGIHHIGDVAAVASYSASSVAEFATHPVANFGNLRRISRFNAIDAAITVKSAGIPLSLAWTRSDAYFVPTQSDMDRAHRNDIPVGMFQGEHDEVVLRPEAFLAQVFSSEQGYTPPAA
jgi:hypothetical protein